MLGTCLTVGILLLSSGSEGATRLSPFEKRYEKTVYPSTVLKFEPGEPAKASTPHNGVTFPPPILLTIGSLIEKY